MHQRIPIIERWGSLSHIRNIMEKIKEANQKARKIGQIVNQALTHELEHDRIQAQWVSDILSKSMLERV